MIIGIPVKNDLACLKAMLRSLYESTQFHDKVIIVDGGSNKETLEYLEELEKVEDDVEVFYEDYDGPIHAYNHLFRIAKERNEDLLLTQTDVIFSKLYERDWLEQMSKIAKHPEIGIVTSLNGGSISGPSYVDGFYWVGGWCTYCSKKIWDIFDGYDESYAKGYGTDIDMTYLVAKKYKVVRMDYWVDHHKMNAREHDKSLDSEQAKQEASKYFKEKWKL